MSITNEKEVKEYILDLEKDSYGVLDVLLDEYFDETISPLFNALYMLLKNSNQNKEKIDYIINLIARITYINIENKNTKALSKISNLIKSLNYKIATNFSKKDKIKINNIKFSLDDLFNRINTTNNIKVRKLTCSA